MTSERREHPGPDEVERQARVLGDRLAASLPDGMIERGAADPREVNVVSRRGVVVAHVTIRSDGLSWAPSVLLPRRRSLTLHAPFRPSFTGARLAALSFAVIYRSIMKRDLWQVDGAMSGRERFEIRRALPTSPDVYRVAAGAWLEPDAGWSVSANDGGPTRWWSTRDLALGDVTLRALAIIGSRVSPPPEASLPLEEVDLEQLERTRLAIGRLPRE